MAKNEERKAQDPLRLSPKMLILLGVFVALTASGVALLAFFFIPQETVPTPITSHLIAFYGRECPHCQRMAPIISEVESELNVSFSRLEVWHNSGNQMKMEEYSGAITQACGGGMGVPAFYNNLTGAALCGEVDKETLLRFSRGS